MVVAPTDSVGTGDGKAYFIVPDEINNMNLVRVAATVITAGTTGTCGIALNNTGTAGATSSEMLSTIMQIESTEISTRTSVTPGTIDIGADNVTTGQIIRIDVDNIPTTAPKGLVVEMAFSLP